MRSNLLWIICRLCHNDDMLIFPFACKNLCTRVPVVYIAEHRNNSPRHCLYTEVLSWPYLLWYLVVRNDRSLAARKRDEVLSPALIFTEAEVINWHDWIWFWPHSVIKQVLNNGKDNTIIVYDIYKYTILYMTQCPIYVCSNKHMN